MYIQVNMPMCVHGHSSLCVCICMFYGIYVCTWACLCVCVEGVPTLAHRCGGRKWGGECSVCECRSLPWVCSLVTEGLGSRPVFVCLFIRQMRQCLSLNSELMDLTSLAGQQGPEIYPSLPRTLPAGVRTAGMCHRTQAFNMGMWDLSSGFHVCMASTLLAEPASQSLSSAPRSAFSVATVVTKPT